MFCNTNRITGQRDVMDINWNRNKSGGKPFSLGERKTFLSDTTKFKQKSMPTLIKSVKGGMPQMPAGGLCDKCSDDDYRKLIEYMSK